MQHTGRRTLLGSLLLLAAVTILAFVELGYGQVRISAGNVLAALLGSAPDPVTAQIVNVIRLPRIVAAMVAGSALGIAGVLMQALFRNPMADAWSLGLTAGGQLGVALVVAAAGFIGPSAISFLQVFESVTIGVAAAAGVAVASATMISLSRRLSTVTLLVVGLMVGFTVQGLVSVIMHYANRVGGRVFSGWNDGTFSAVTVADLPMMAAPVLAGIVLATMNAKGLSSLLLGESYAQSVGADVVWLRRFTLLSTLLLIAPVTAFCGPITFVGLIVPHFARAIAGTARILPLLSLAALSGAVLTLAADLVVHLPWEQHFLHLNAVLAIVGAPVVIGLLAFSPSMRGQR